MKKLLFLPVVIIFASKLYTQVQFKAQVLAKTLENDLRYQFQEYKILEFPLQEINAHIKSNKSGSSDLTLLLPIYGEYKLKLYPYDILSNDYEVTLATKNGLIKTSKTEVNTFRGEVLDNPKSKVLLTISDNTFFGTIFDGNREIMFEPLFYLKPKSKITNAIVIYETNKVNNTKGNFCGVTEAQNIVEKIISGNKNIKSIVGECKEVEIAIASDSYMSARYGNDVSVVLTHNIGVMNLVNGLYDTPLFTTPIKFVIKGQNISTSEATDQLNPSGFANGTIDMIEVYFYFKSWDQNPVTGFDFDFDISLLFTARSTPNTNGNILGLTFINSTCAINSKYVVVKDFGPVDPTGAAYTGIINIVAHELGHTLGMGHDSFGFIMQPSASESNLAFSQTSINSLNTYLANQNQSFCLSNCATVLPVALLEFNIFKFDNGVNLTWKTTIEKNFSHFEVQSSTDAKEFGTLAIVKGNQSNIYNQIDNSPNEGENYYRLKMVDVDGSSTLSKIVTVNFEKDASYVSVENPANNGEFKVMTNLKNPRFTLMTATGSRVEFAIVDLAKNEFSIKAKNPVSGVYFLNIESNGHLQTKKMMMP